MSRTIIIVDDAPVDLAMAVAALESGGFGNLITACNGEEALELVRDLQPDLVITDMQMPVMDGLTLVRKIHDERLFAPTILITAHGSEELAVEALRAGAASYVRKQDMADRLVDTVRDVLSVTPTPQQRNKLRACWGQTQSSFTVDNDEEVVPALVSHLQQYTANMRLLDENESFRIGVALHEALRNAINHGNLELSSDLRESGEYYKLAKTRADEEPYRNRKVYIEAIDREDSTTYTIHDEGPGFRHNEFDYDPQDAANISRLSGRGLFLIRTFMDEVAFNETGNQITMTHRNGSPPGNSSR